MNMDKLLAKKELITILAERLYPALDNAEKDAMYDYRITGKTDRQRTNWKTNELMFDEDGNPIYEDKWEYVKKEEDEITDKDRATITAIEIIRNALEKLI